MYMRQKMRNKKLIIPPILICISIMSCSMMWGKSTSIIGQQDVTKEIRGIQFDEFLDVKPNTRLLLKKNINLNGKIVRIPKGVVIEPRGGVFYNGQLVGDNTTIVGPGCLFDNVKISGEWCVSEISTSMFKDLSEVNSLQNVISLASGKIFNHIIIESGNYYVEAPRSGGALIIPSNTKLVIEGNIFLKPNEYPRCYVVHVPNAENVNISGDGAIWGDKMEHTGNDGEWGHGIYIAGSKNVSVSNLSIYNCWGDCIYIGSKCTDINILNCTLENGRRQGISITSAIGVRIENCRISNVSGCKPGLGIDIEPNNNCIVDSIVINNVIIENCFGGISTGGHPTARLGKIAIDNCFVVGTEKKLSVVFSKAERVTMTNTTIESDKRIAIKAVNVGEIRLVNNVVKSNHIVPILVKDCDNKFLKENIILRIAE